MFCINCGYRLQEDAAFCNDCGAKVSVFVDDDEPQQISEQTASHHETPELEVFPQELSQHETTQQDVLWYEAEQQEVHQWSPQAHQMHIIHAENIQQGRRAKSKKTPIIAITAVLIILAAIVFTLFWLQNNNDQPVANISGNAGINTDEYINADTPTDTEDTPTSENDSTDDTAQPSYDPDDTTPPLYPDDVPTPPETEDDLLYNTDDTAQPPDDPIQTPQTSHPLLGTWRRTDISVSPLAALTEEAMRAEEEVWNNHVTQTQMYIRFFEYGVGELLEFFDDGGVVGFIFDWIIESGQVVMSWDNVWVHEHHTIQFELAGQQLILPLIYDSTHIPDLMDVVFEQYLGDMPADIPGASGLLGRWSLTGAQISPFAAEILTEGELSRIETYLERYSSIWGIHIRFFADGTGEWTDFSAPWREAAFHWEVVDSHIVFTWEEARRGRFLDNPVPYELRGGVLMLQLHTLEYDGESARQVDFAFRQ